MTYMDLPPLVRVWEATWQILLLFLYFFMFVDGIWRKRKKSVNIAVGTMFGVIYILEQYFTERIHIMQGWEQTAPGFDWFERVPDGVWIAFQFFATVLVCYLMEDFHRYDHSHISPVSIKEALDSLPAGVCFYQASGRVLLINKRMDKIARTLTGKAVLQGADYWEEIRKEPIREFPDGSVYQFYRQTVRLCGEDVFEIIAADITEEYRLGEKLRAETEKLAKQGERLRNLGELMTNSTIEKEMLTAKMQIHDNLGNALILVRHYLTQETDITPEAIVDLWQGNLRLFQNEAGQEVQDDYHALLQAGEDVGVHIEVEGILPEKPNAKRAAIAAMDACLTNTFQHAEGNQLNVVVTKTDSGTNLQFTNNGKPPAGDIRETGGLQNLRNMVESYGGTMQVQSCPGFLLTITVPENV